MVNCMGEGKSREIGENSRSVERAQAGAGVDSIMKKGGIAVTDEDLWICSNQGIIEERQYFVSMRAADGANDCGDGLVAKGDMEFLASSAN